MKKESLFAAIDQRQAEILSWGDAFFDCAELGFQEVKTAAAITALLDQWNIPYESGIAKGMPEELFVPNRPVTREQMATFFARYAGYCGMTTETEGDLAGFVDAGEVSGYAVESMTWAVEAGLIEGVSSEEPTLRPKGSSTRAQVAAVVMRFAALGQS